MRETLLRALKEKLGIEKIFENCISLKGLVFKI